MKIKELLEAETPGQALYKKLRANPEAANIHKEGQGTVGASYRLGLAGSICPKWLPKNGSEAYYAWKAGRDNFKDKKKNEN